MLIEFTAAEVDADDEDDELLASLWFRQARDSRENRYLAIARPTEGDHPIYIERDDQHWAYEGAVSLAELSPTSLALQLPVEGIDALGGVSRFLVHFSDPPEKLCAAFRAIFREHARVEAAAE